MKWFVEERNALGHYQPALYSARPALTKDMRIKMANSQGPKVRRAPVQIEPRDHRLPLHVLQRIYGGEYATS